MIFVDIKRQKIYDFPINSDDNFIFITDDLILKGEIRTRYDGFGESEEIHHCKLYKLTIINDALQYDKFFTFRSHRRRRIGADLDCSRSG